MGCPTLTFNLAPDAWIALKATAAANGMALTEDSGTVIYKKCTFTYSYQCAGGAGSLNITCLDKPWDYPCGTVNDELTKLIQGG